MEQALINSCLASFGGGGYAAANFNQVNAQILDKPIDQANGVAARPRKAAILFLITLANVIQNPVLK